MPTVRHLTNLIAQVDITPKTAAATAGATAGGSLSVSVVSLIDWILSYWHISIPATAAASLATLLSAGGAFGLAWLAPHSAPTPEQIAQIKQQP